MWRTNLKVALLGLAVIGFYTLIAHIIPQLESEVPEVLTLGADASPEALVEAGERMYNGAGACSACHGLGTRAPNLLTGGGGLGPIGSRCGERVAGTPCKDYLYESMTEPGAYVVAGFENIMPDMRRQLSIDQIWAVIAFLQAQGGEVTVTGADLAQDAAVSSGGSMPVAATPATASTDPQELLAANGCIGCHQLAGSGGAVGPSFDGIGGRMTPAQLRQSILDPGAEVAEGYDQFAGMMPATFGEQFTAAQLEAVVKFLAELR
ncbi:MAG: c-type cytochrome [Gemmatimonadales bacterium]|nr:c-type cytochrome [Gemmatimonadales bacterium]